MGHPIRKLLAKEYLHPVYHSYQCTDEEGPCLPPDFIDGRNSDLSREERRLLYQKRYRKSPSAKRGCRHYVRGMLYKNIDPSLTWIIEPSSEMAEMDLHITVHVGPNGRKTGKAGLHHVSVLKVRYLPAVIGESQCASLLGAIHEHCVQVKRVEGVGHVLGMVTMVGFIQLDVTSREKL